MKSDNIIARAVNTYVLLKRDIKEKTKQVNQIKDEFVNDFIASKKTVETYQSKTNKIKLSWRDSRTSYENLLKDLINQKLVSEEIITSLKEKHKKLNIKMNI